MVGVPPAGRQLGRRSPRLRRSLAPHLVGEGRSTGGEEGNVVILQKGPNPRTTPQNTTHT